MTKAPKKPEIPLAKNSPTKPPISPLISGVLAESETLNKQEEALLAQNEELHTKVQDILRQCKDKMDELSQKVNEYDKNATNLEITKQELDKHQIEINNQKSLLEAKKNLLTNLESDLNQQTILLQQSQLKLIEEQAELNRRKGLAEQGFLAEKLRITTTAQQESQRIYDETMSELLKKTTELNTKEAEIEAQRVELAQNLATLVSSNQVVLQNRLAELQEEHTKNLSTIAEKELAVIQANEKLNLEREQLREDIAQFEQKIALHQQKVQWDYQGQIDDLKQYNQHIEKTLEKTNRHNNELKEKLRNFAELQTQLAENDIASISDTLTTLQRENRELKQKLSERQEDGLEELNEELERRVSELEEQIFELTNKNASMSAQLHQQRMSVQARHFLEQEKLALENHKRILTAIVDEQTKKLEGLEAQQSGHLPFKALSQMDSDYRSKPPSLIDVPALSEFVKIIQANIAKQNLYYSLDDIRLFIAGLAMSKLHLLQGISGTGKTSLAQSFARAMNNVYDKEHSKLYCEMVRVQAGWRDKEDLLGYYNEFEKRFNSKETLQALYRAQQPQFEDTLQIILLDEMNLSQPEQYFAEFLSLFETPDTDFINLIDAGNDNAPRYFVDKRAIRVPKNVWFIGTANHDETTKEFADKTYDRAHIMEVKRSQIETINLDYQKGDHFSYSSLEKRFTEARLQYKNVVDKILTILKDSDFAKTLASVGVGWGNRLEEQAKKFIPVYIACGGTASQALDHLLASKVLRRGKVVGRYDTSAEKLKNIQESIEDMWVLMDFADAPIASKSLLQEDIQRLEGSL